MLHGTKLPDPGLAAAGAYVSDVPVPTTVTNRYPVEEEGHSVHAFWETFYSSLAEHHGNANEAFHDAQRAVADVSGAEADWGSFSLVIRDQSGEVMRIEEAGTISTEKWEEESQAQFASRFANDMAERLFSLGPKVPESIQKEFEQEVETASELARNLYRKG